MRLIDVSAGEYCKTNKGRFLRCRGTWLFDNEFGVRVCDLSVLNDNTTCEIIEGWPILHVGEGFELINKKLYGHPNERLIFQTNEGFRFIVDTKNYRMSIPFVFPTTDERLEWGSANWTASSGRVPHALKGHQLYLSYDKGSKPTLHVGFVPHMTIPSQ